MGYAFNFINVVIPIKIIISNRRSLINKSHDKCSEPISIRLNQIPRKILEFLRLTSGAEVACTEGTSLNCRRFELEQAPSSVQLPAEPARDVSLDCIH